MERKLKITTDVIKDIVKQGFPVTCATCKHLYRGLDEGKSDCGKTECGGPLSGKGFPLYDGQISRTNFPNICLICGDSKVTHLVIASNTDKFGLCDLHCKIYNQTFNGPGMIVKPTVIKFS